MASILRVRDENGQIIEIPALKGKDGVGIESIQKTSTEGLIDTYTITLTDGRTSTFTVTNGKDSSVGSIETPMKVSQLENDTNFVSAEYVNETIEDCESALTKQVSDLTDRVDKIENAVSVATIDSIELNTMIEEVLA